MARRGPLVWPARWWARQSLRARLTLLATALFSVAVATGAILVLILQRYALVRVLDTSAAKTAADIAREIEAHPGLRVVAPTTAGAGSVQVLDASNGVVAASPDADPSQSMLTAAQLAEARSGEHFDITDPDTGGQIRVLGHRADRRTVVVYTDLSRVDDALRVLTRAAVIGGPIAVLLVGLSTYFVVALTLRSVAALRHGAADISAAGLSGQRLPVPSAQDEIHRLAVTLNTMLDRIESSTFRQRTFVGDAAHELRSPLASLRVQVEIAQRLGPEKDWPTFLADVLVDVDRLDRLVEDLLALARMDETGGPTRVEPVRLDELAGEIVAGYDHARVPVRLTARRPATVDGDPDGLRRVIVNLVDNAVRYAEAGVDVAVTVEPKTVTLAVSDDGPGIPAAERERVFDRFYRLEASRSRESGGTGLGLPIVRDLVRAHHGTVALTGRPDGMPGLHAVVTLPRSTGG